MSQTGQSGGHRALPDLSKLSRPVFARSETLEPGSWTVPHSHPWGQFTYASQGILEVRTPEGSHMAPPQRAVWVPPGLEHSVHNAGPALMRSLYIDAGAAPWIASAPCRVLIMTPLARELALVAASLPPDYPPDGPQSRLVAVLLDQIAALPEADLSLPFPSGPRLAALCGRLRDDPGDQSTLEDLARQAGMSGRTLARLFERETGLGFREWRLRLRLLLSLPLIERGEKITSVAMDLGYDSTSAFIAAFRRHFGRTPGDYFSTGV